MSELEQVIAWLRTYEGHDILKDWHVDYTDQVPRAFRVYKARRAIPARRGLLAKLARLAPRVILARRVSAVSRGCRARLARRGLPERTACRLMMRR